MRKKQERNKEDMGGKIETKHVSYGTTMSPQFVKEGRKEVGSQARIY